MRAALTPLLLLAYSLMGLPHEGAERAAALMEMAAPMAPEPPAAAEVTAQTGPVAVLMYHHLAPDGAEPGIATPEQLDAQIAALKEAGYRFISAQEFAAFIDRKLALPERSILLTFDDGYASNFVLGLPILEKHQVPALIFPVMRYFETEGRGAWSPHLTWEQGRKLLASGLVTLGGHTYNGHSYIPTGADGTETGPWLTSRMWLADELRLETESEYLARIQADIVLTRSLLRQVGQQGALHFALPFGEGNEIVLAQLKEHGFQYVYTTDGALLNEAGAEPQHVFRIDAGSPHATADWLLQRLQNAFAR